VKIPSCFKICQLCQKVSKAVWEDDQQCAVCQPLDWRLNPDTQKLLAAIPRYQ
jgi:hypothetical protein